MGFEDLMIKSEVITDWTLNIQDGYNLIFYCLLVWAVYAAMKPFMKEEKSVAWIIMLISSFSLSIFGTMYVYTTTVHSLWTIKYLYTEDYLARHVNTFFVASNIVDLAVGFIDYPKFMDPFSTVAHHIFYINFIVWVVMCFHYTTGFVHCYFLELPTFLLSVGTIWPEYRSDLIFGILFLITRVGWNIHLTWVLYRDAPNERMWYVSVLILSLHLYWFSKWCANHGKRLIFGKGSDNKAKKNDDAKGAAASTAAKNGANTKLPQTQNGSK